MAAGDAKSLTELLAEFAARESEREVQEGKGPKPASEPTAITFRNADGFEAVLTLVHRNTNDEEWAVEPRGEPRRAIKLIGTQHPELTTAYSWASRWRHVCAGPDALRRAVSILYAVSGLERA